MRKLSSLLFVVLPVVALAQTPPAATPTKSPVRLFGRARTEAQPAAAAPTATPVTSLSTPVVGRVTSSQNNTQKVAQAATRRTPARDTQSDSDSEKDKPSSREEKRSAAAERSSSDKSERRQAQPKTDAQLAEEKYMRLRDEVTTRVNEFLLAANNGEYTKAAGYLTPQLQKYFQSEMSVNAGGIKTVLDAISHDGGIRRVNYGEVRLRGEGGRVETEIYYESGASEKRPFELLRIGGEWFIVLPVAGRGIVQTPAAIATPPARPMLPGQTPASSPAVTPATPPPTSPASTPRAQVPAAAPATSAASAIEPSALRSVSATLAQVSQTTVSALAGAPWR